MNPRPKYPGLEQAWAASGAFALAMSGLVRLLVAIDLPALSRHLDGLPTAGPTPGPLRARMVRLKARKCTGPVGRVHPPGWGGELTPGGGQLARGRETRCIREIAEKPA